MFFNTALETLEAIKVSYNRLLISFSGGKDSQCLLKHALHVYPKSAIELFFMYNVAEHPYNQYIQDVADSFNIPIHFIQHFGYFKDKHNGIFCKKVGKEKKLADIYKEMRAFTGIQPILVGAKADDSQWRRVVTGKAYKGQYELCFYPIWDVSTADVIKFCKFHNLNIQKLEQSTNSGISLASPHLIWAYKYKPEWFNALKKEFPFIEACIKRKEWYGIGANIK